MPRSYPQAVLDALDARALVARDFVWFTVRDRSDGSPHSEGYWSDVGTVDAEVHDPVLGSDVVRTFTGSGSLIAISAVPLVSNLSSRPVTVRLSQVLDRIEALVRDYDPAHGSIQVYRGLFDPTTRALVAPAQPRFVGRINGAPITTPADGGEGAVEIECRSLASELSRFNPARRSDADQRRRSATDDFFADAETIGQLQIFWGVKEA